MVVAVTLVGLGWLIYPNNMVSDKINAEWRPLLGFVINCLSAMIVLIPVSWLPQ
jgi:hypothetical protein